MSEDRFSLKDHLFNREKVAMLGGWMAGAEAGFDAEGFTETVVARFPELELKQRIDWIAECLMARLPGEFPGAAEVIAAALPPPLDPTLRDDDFGDFILAPFGVVVERMGIGEPERALDLFEAITQRFSMELSIRAFLNRWPEAVLARMEAWTAHENYHVRRLVSEGTRPKLPWAQAISLPPGAALPLLDRLHADPTRYVTRSVANHLNDISKSDPEAVLARLDGWRAEARQAPKELVWMSRHALRTRIKSGYAPALDFLGYRAEAPVALVSMQMPEVVEIGGVLDLRVVLEAAEAVPAIVDFVVEFAKPGGKTREKVFRMKDLVLPAGKPVELQKKHRLKGDATTFTLYPGAHRVWLQVNGRRIGDGVFELVEAAR